MCVISQYVRYTFYFLGLLVLSIMGLSSFSVLISVLILYLHHKNTVTRVPRWLRIFVFRGLAAIMCMRRGMPEIWEDDSKVAPDDTGDVESINGVITDEKRGKAFRAFMNYTIISDYIMQLFHFSWNYQHCINRLMHLENKTFCQRSKETAI